MVGKVLNRDRWLSSGSGNGVIVARLSNDMLQESDVAIVNCLKFLSSDMGVIILQRRYTQGLVSRWVTVTVSLALNITKRESIECSNCEFFKIIFWQK